MGMDIFVLRALLGDRARLAPASAYVRSAIDAYAVNILAPAGRASGEVARALSLAPHIGPGPVAASAIGVQGSSLVGTAGISMVCFAVLASHIGPAARLSLLLAANVALTSAAGVTLLFGARSPRVWRTLRRVVKSLPPVEHTAHAPGARPLRAALLSVTGRGVETFLWLGLLWAAARTASITQALGAQSVELVAALFGDLVPQRAGVTEGAFWLFGTDIGLPSPASAVALALLYRVNQLLLAALCLVVGLVWRRRPPATPPDAGQAAAGAP